MHWRNSGHPNRFRRREGTGRFRSLDGFRVSKETFSIKTGAVIDIKIFVDHDMIEVFIGKEFLK